MCLVKCLGPKHNFYSVDKNLLFLFSGYCFRYVCILRQCLADSITFTKYQFSNVFYEDFAKTTQWA